jgi:Fic family protein
MIYEETHPHLKFTINLSHAPSRFWLLLGEAKSKCEHISGVPLAPEVATKLHTVLLAKGVHATTAIEGNTLSVEEVQKRIEGRLALPPSKAYQGIEIDNVISGFHTLLARIDDPDFELLTVERIQEYNRVILGGLELQDGVIPGQIPFHNVGVAGYLAPPRQECSHLLAKLCAWLNQPAFIPNDDMRVPFGIVRAILAHLYLAWIHPFGDGNGRTARMLEVQILLAAGLPTAAAHLLSNHYNDTRAEYYRQLEKSSKLAGDPWDFLEYALQGLIDGLKAHLAEIRAYQHEIIWHEFIYSHFKEPDTAVSRRRKRLMLALSDTTEPVPVSRIKVLTPDVYQDYAGKTLRTLHRDVQELSALGLVAVSREGVTANKDLILSFLPLKRRAAI